jgi:hypothetical protein
MVNLGSKVDLKKLSHDTSTATFGIYLWRLERIISREMNSQKENTSLVRTIFGTHNSCLPVEKVISNRACRTRGRRVALEIFEFLLRKKKGN